MILDQLTQLKNIDIRTVDPAKLIDASNVKVNIELPKIERMLDVARQMGDSLYCFKVGKTIVKIGHAATDATIDDKVESFMRMQ